MRQVLHGMVVNIHNHSIFATLILLSSPYGLILVNAIDHKQAKFASKVFRNTYCGGVLMLHIIPSGPSSVNTLCYKQLAEVYLCSFSLFLQ